MCRVYTRGVMESVAAGETEGFLVKASYIAIQNMLTEVRSGAFPQKTPDPLARLELLSKSGASTSLPTRADHTPL